MYNTDVMSVQFFMHEVKVLVPVVFIDFSLHLGEFCADITSIQYSIYSYQAFKQGLNTEGRILLGSTILAGYHFNSMDGSFSQVMAQNLADFIYSKNYPRQYI